MDSWWCEDHWMNVTVKNNLPSGNCLGKDAVVTSRMAMLRQFKRDLTKLSTIDLQEDLPEIHDSEVIEYLRLFGSESIKVSVTLKQGNNTFKTELDLAANLGKKLTNGVADTAETVLMRIVVEVLAARRILRKNDAQVLNSFADHGNIWWCEDHWIKVDNFTVGDGNCWGRHSVVMVNRALLRQLKKDIEALNTLEPLQNLEQLSNCQVIDCLHLLGCESVDCKITLEREGDTYIAEWNLPTNSIVKSSQPFCSSCGNVLPETVIGRILVEILAAKGHLQKQHLGQPSSESVQLTANTGISPSPPDSPCSAGTLLHDEISSPGRQPIEKMTGVVGDAVTSTSSDFPAYSDHEPFLNSLKFEPNEEVKIHDTLGVEPMDTLQPQTPSEHPPPKEARLDSMSSSCKARPPKRSAKIPIRSRMMEISLAGPQKRQQDKDRVLSTMKMEQNILKLGRLTGLRCNMDPEWSLKILKCATECKKLHHIEVLWPRREHWYQIHNLFYLRKLEVYADDELYLNPPPAPPVPPSHALRIETIQSQGLHPFSLGSLMKAHSSLVRLEVLVDLPQDCTFPKDKPLGPEDGGRPMSDTELRKLLERAPGQASQSSSQENNTKLVRVALRKPRNVPLSLALPVSMFLPKDWRRVGSGRTGLRQGAGRLRQNALFSEYAVPVEEDCRRFPNLETLVLIRPTEQRHSSKACIPQIRMLRRKWPSMLISCERYCEKVKKEQKQKGRVSSPKPTAKHGNTNFFFHHKRKLT